MEDPYTLILETLEGLLADRAKAAAGNLPYRHFWDFMRPESGVEVFTKELSRDDLYEQLQETASREHRFNEWLPAKVRLAFVASFERDARILNRSRISAFSGASKGYEYRAEMARQMVDHLKTIAQASNGSK